MSQTINRAFEISDGLASMAQKRIKALISELEHEGVMTKSESAAAHRRLGQAKTHVYDALTKEFKKVLAQSAPKATTKKRSKRRK